MEITFTVPGRPRPKARARIFWDPRAKRIRAANPAATVAYEKTVAGYALQARQRLAAPWPRDGRYRLDVVLYFAGRRGDADNYLKAIGDALSKDVLWKSDIQVVDWHVRVLSANGAGERAEIEVALVGGLTANIL